MCLSHILHFLVKLLRLIEFNPFAFVPKHGSFDHAVHIFYVRLHVLVYSAIDLLNNVEDLLGYLVLKLTTFLLNVVVLQVDNLAVQRGQFFLHQVNCLFVLRLL